MISFSHTVIRGNDLPFTVSTQRRTDSRRQLRVSASVAAPAAPAPTMYELLSVTETAGPEEIKAAYRREARRWHPDACRSGYEKSVFAERFMQARQAYEVLSDPTLRHGYDLSLRYGGRDGGGASVRREGFGDWDAQLERLRTKASTEETWGARMRRARSRSGSSN